jgi:hypothetical protein
MISENEHLVNRDQLFKNSRYLIFAKVEKASSNDQVSFEESINGLK